MAYVVSQDKDVFFVARHDLRGKGVMYKVHGFKLANAAEVRMSYTRGYALKPTCFYDCIAFSSWYIAAEPTVTADTSVAAT